MQAGIYRHLASLQGHVIPYLIAAGWWVGNMYGILAMEAWGQTISSKELTKQDAAVAMEALQKVGLLSSSKRPALMAPCSLCMAPSTASQQYSTWQGKGCTYSLFGMDA